MKKTGWGILGTGSIAKLFSRAIKSTDCAYIAAVGSRTAESAEKFAEEFGVPAYGSYEQMVNRGDVDVVYIATPNTYHYEHSMLALKAGKGVMCEKPLTINAKEAGTLILYAKEHGLFFCEAMWPRFFPATDKVREWLKAGVIGDVRLVTVNFGFTAPVNPESRLFKPELGGGALLDIGVYDIAFATMVMGSDPPDSIYGGAYICETGVDGVTSVILNYGTSIVSLNCGLVTNLNNHAVIYGQNGRIEISDRFWAPVKAQYYRGGELAETYEHPYECNGYEYEIKETARCLNEGLTESPYMTCKDSLNVMKIMDEVRNQIGLKYPGEK